MKAFPMLSSASLPACWTSSRPIRRGFPPHSRTGGGLLNFVLGIGDIVAVQLFEAGAGGLFIPLEAGARAGNFVTLTNQAVDNNGNISIPYGGTIRAQGRTPVEVQKAIVDALKDRALEPQALVTIVEQRSSSISVLGDGVGSVRFPASASGERVLDAITRAGLRPTGPASDLWVMLERDRRRETIPFGALVYEPVNNIYVRPNDTIFVYRDPQTFLAFGASGRQGQLPFDAWRISLAEAAAKAGGLNDVQADPASIFLYREKLARWRRCWGSIARRSADRLFQSSITSICAIQQATSWPANSRCTTRMSYTFRTHRQSTAPSS